VTRGSTEIALEIPVDTAWNALVAPGLRAWYHRLTPEGNFEEGHAIRWRDVLGEVVEESEIVELEPPRRMIAHTRFVFSPAYAHEPPHTMTWELTREGSGCRVRMSWDANDRVAHFLGSEGHYLLQSLRLEHDPVAQAEIARLPTIGEVAIHDVTPDRLADYQTFFDHDAFRDFPSWQACYCMAPYQTGDEDPEPTAAENRREMSAKITRSTVVALLAYVDGKPVGWCNYGETTWFAGLKKRFELKPAEAEGVGSIACFVIAAPYRGHGVATRLLAAAMDRMRDRGVRVVEAYPAKDIDSPQSSFRGPLSMYLKAGFQSYRETGPYQIVRKTL
jgi:GNAT superfamily N-acetyltransferase